MDAEKQTMQRRIDTLDQHAVKLHAALTEYERENARLKADLEIAKIQNQYISEVASAYEKDIEKLERERDAAVSDLNRARHCLTCEVNRDSKDENAPEFRLLCRPCHYAWRGPCKENGGAEENAQSTCT